MDWSRLQQETPYKTRNWRSDRRYKGWEDEEEDVGTYCTILRKREDTGNWKKWHQIALCGEFDVEMAVDLS